ncbi:hypothetical protein [Pseudanabaena yagii]|uniref:Uncharacterized protein n=1 Tax=Pseudanabaena yagii GIHE-NHR1 TaxID=2722753 RepID=A0ABX1LPF9_9CYAN|nr:hypothetical protein [Pseudanabaena yagii]NMF56921.1 hypothetical protein [Pseudanabaena yagii GIHE-NHR1]
MSCQSLHNLRSCVSSLLDQMRSTHHWTLQNSDRLFTKNQNKVLAISFKSLNIDRLFMENLKQDDHLINI